MSTYQEHLLRRNRQRLTVADDDNWDNDFATAISPSALQLPHLKPQDNFGGMLSADRLKAFASIDECRNVASNWDDDFDAQLMTIKGPQHVPDPDPQERTIRPPPKTTEKATKSPKAGRRRGGRPAAHVSQPKSPAKSQFANKFELPSRPEALYREQSVEDYSDLFADNDSVFTNRPNLVVRVPPPPTAVSRSPELLRTHTPLDSPQLFHPSDLVSLPRSMQPPTGGSMRRQASSRPSVLPDRPMRRTRSSVEIERFAENGDEDFSDIFGPEDALTERDESDRSSEDGGLMLLSKLSNNSWLGDEEDEDDPFAMIDPGWDQMDLEANIARDRHARLAEKVEELVRSLKQDEGEDRLDELSEDLVRIYLFSPTRYIAALIRLPARASLGEQRGKESHHQRPRPAADPRNSRALHGQEQAARHPAAPEDRQCRTSSRLCFPINKAR